MSEERFDRLEQMVANLIGMVGSMNTQFAEMRQELAQTNADLAQTNAELAKTNAETAKNSAELAQTNAELAKTNAGLAQTNAEVAQNSAGLAKLNAEVTKNSVGLAKLTEEMAATKQVVFENANRLDRIEHHVQHQGERFQEFDKRLVNVEHGMYRVSCVERAQNKMLVHLHEVDVELSLVKDKLPATLEPRELEKVSS